MKGKSSRNFILSCLFVAVCVAALLFATISYSGVARGIFKEEFIASLGEVAKQSVAVLESKVNAELGELKNVATLIQSDSMSGISADSAAITQKLSIIRVNNGYKRMGLAFKDGRLFTTDGVSMDLSTREFVKNGLMGESSISDTLTDMSDGKEINVSSTPVLDGQGNVTAVLFSTHETGVYKRLLETSSFGGEGYSYVVKRSGDAVVGSSNPASFQSFGNLIQSIEEACPGNAHAAHQLLTDMQAGSSGYIEAVSGEETEFYYYTPTSINDWYLVTVVPSGLLETKLANFMKLSYTFTGSLLIVFFLLIAYVFWVQAQGHRSLERLVYEDALTGGGSYRRFLEDAELALRHAPPGGFALVSLDVDKFKYVNDLFGYEEGNNVIRFISETLGGWLRPGELMAHQNADNFVALVAASDETGLRERLEQLCTGVRTFYSNTARRYDLAVAIGVYVVKDTGMDIDTMVDRAGLPRKSVKGKHGSVYAFYDETLRNRQLRNKEIENEMASALEQKRFAVYFQPKIKAEDGRLSGAEALVRWVKQDGTVIPPGEFIPLFESNGFITELDKFVFRETCRKLRYWMDEGLPPVSISVNLSRLHLYNPQFIRDYMEVVSEYGIPSRFLQLELTESALFENRSNLLAIMRRLHESGFKILMDDFGTGYSSLQMLKDIPIDILKLDKSFVDDISVNRKSEQIIIKIVQLAQSLGMAVTAEGVETEKQYEFLREAGCDDIQGYFFSRPVDGVAFEKMLREEANKVDEGHKKFFDFILERVQEGSVEEAKSLLEEAFSRQAAGRFSAAYMQSFAGKMLPLLKPEYAEEVKSVMASFKG